MIPAIDYNTLIETLKIRTREHNYPMDASRIRMLGLVFASPNSPLSISEIIPQLNDWYYRSGNHIDFFFAGYTFYHPPGGEYINVRIPGEMNWLYSANKFDIFRRELENRTNWKYSGEPEILLTNVCINNNITSIDFTSTIICLLNKMMTQGAFSSVGNFFESIFRFAETSDDSDPTWGFGKAMQLEIVGSSLKRVILSLIPQNLGGDLESLKHFGVADIARRQRI